MEEVQILIWLINLKLQKLRKELRVKWLRVKIQLTTWILTDKENLIKYYII